MSEKDVMASYEIIIKSSATVTGNRKTLSLAIWSTRHAIMSRAIAGESRYPAEAVDIHPPCLLKVWGRTCSWPHLPHSLELSTEPAWRLSVPRPHPLLTSLFSPHFRAPWITTILFTVFNICFARICKLWFNMIKFAALFICAWFDFPSPVKYVLKICILENWKTKYK